jgi:hypothetical protein
MFFLRCACFVFTFFALSCADTTRMREDECADAGEWCKLDRGNEYPPCFPAAFTDSLRSVKHAFPAFGLRDLGSLPFSKGEKFVYDVGWGPISAGYVILETAMDPSTGQCVVVGKGMTNGFFSPFYKVRDYIRTTLDPRGIYPFYFEQHLREGRYRADRWEIFDQAHSKVYTHNNDTEAVSAPPFVQNYFSLIAYVRSLPFSPGDSFYTDCFVHTKSYRIMSHCIARKPVEVAAGTFNCLLVKPVLVGEGRVFTKKDEIRLWLTDDAYKMPVMVKAKIRFGSITARLIWYERKE